MSVSSVIAGIVPAMVSVAVAAGGWIYARHTRRALEASGALVSKAEIDEAADKDPMIVEVGSRSVKIPALARDMLDGLGLIVEPEKPERSGEASWSAPKAPRSPR